MHKRWFSRYRGLLRQERDITRKWEAAGECWVSKKATKMPNFLFHRMFPKMQIKGVQRSNPDSTTHYSCKGVKKKGKQTKNLCSVGQRSWRASGKFQRLFEYKCSKDKAWSSYRRTTFERSKKKKKKTLYIAVIIYPVQKVRRLH